MIDGEPWFVARGICDLPEIQNSREPLGNLEDSERVYAIYTPLVEISL
jgi:prophage antirepressor-like protein